MSHKRVLYLAAIAALALTCTAGTARADDDQGSNECKSLPGHTALQSALAAATATEASGLNNQMWATLVDRDGVVCAVAFSGVDRGAQWPGSRVISAQKDNTANAFSLDSSSSSGGSGQPNGLSLSTANLYSAVQPGGSLFGLQESNPVDTAVAYKGPSSQYGTADDPMVGKKIGGVNVFGGGLALYGTGKKIIGGVGVSGDTSCADHNISWRVRNNLKLDHLSGVGGVSGDPARPDNIIFDITPNPSGGTGISAGGFGHLSEYIGVEYASPGSTLISCLTSRPPCRHSRTRRGWAGLSCPHCLSACQRHCEVIPYGDLLDELPDRFDRIAPGHRYPAGRIMDFETLV
jgi:uncharacterized protein GlcG (DUF336 family)